MTDEKTVEVDADRLSDELVEELIEEGELDKDTAEEWGDRVWFDEMADKSPERSSATGYIYNRAVDLKNLSLLAAGGLRNGCRSFIEGLKSQSTQKIKNLREDKTVFAEIDDVRRSDNDTVELVIRHSCFRTERLELDPNSVELMNLLSYNSVDNPVDLEGCSVFVSPQTFNDVSKEVLIPHNVSISGIARFKIYTFIREITRKTRIESLNISFDELSEIGIFGSFVFLIIGFIGEGLAGTVLHPIGVALVSVLGLWVGLCFLTISYYLYRFIMFVSRFVFGSDFHEVETRPI